MPGFLNLYNMTTKILTGKAEIVEQSINRLRKYYNVHVIGISYSGDTVAVVLDIVSKL